MIRTRASLRQKDETRERWKGEPKNPYIGPMPIINIALNVVKGSKLAWQERKAVSFTFTPLYSGYEFGGTPLGTYRRDTASDAYRPTRKYGYTDDGIALGTAIAISGAAANPNMGFHTSAPLAFLMTVFNARLGWWMGNPRRNNKWQRSSPGFGLMYLLAELTGNANDWRSFINLSDGGHFENLGIYELVRRHCSLIIACDAEEDYSSKFQGLANAIRKVRIDFGVEIGVRNDAIYPIEVGGQSRAHCVVGHIRYPGGAIGRLLYLKSSLTGDETTDVQEYAARNAEFPHQTTADQWFDESQFESYRKLGHHIFSTAFERAIKSHEWTGFANKRRDELQNTMERLEYIWYPPTDAIQRFFVKHASELRALSETLRKEDGLSFLDGEVFAGIGGDQATTDRNAFYLTHSMLQLMESAFLELNLDEELRNPHYAGWLRLFQHWAEQAHFRGTWLRTREDYGVRFRISVKRSLAYRDNGTQRLAHAWPR